MFGKDVHIFSDELNHASNIDGLNASRAKLHIFKHRDYAGQSCIYFLPFLFLHSSYFIKFHRLSRHKSGHIVLKCDIFLNFRTLNKQTNLKSVCKIMLYFIPAYMQRLI